MKLTTQPAGAKRGIRADVALRYGYVGAEVDGELYHAATFKDAKGAVVGYKLRSIEHKSFRWFGRDKMKPVPFFGQHLYPNGRYLVITEGEIDALSVATADSKEWPVVSLPDGAGSATRAVQENIEWLRGFEKITLCFDMDAAGQEAVAEVAKLLPPEKLFVAKLPRKDANEVLLQDGAEKLFFAIRNAEPYRPVGILSRGEILEEINRVPPPGLPYPWRFLDEALGGQRPGEITLVAAGTSTGKSTFLWTILEHLLQQQQRVGAIFLENSVRELVAGILARRIGRRVEHAEDLTPYAADIAAILDQTEVYNPKRGWTPEDLAETIRVMAAGLGCRFVILDHISIAFSGSATEGDERKRIDELMTSLRQIAVTTGVHVYAATHLRRVEKTSHEEGDRVRLADLRGSGALAQIANNVIALERDTQAPDPEQRDLTTIRVLKARSTGFTGPVGYLRYDHATTKLYETNGSPRSPEETGHEAGSPFDPA